MGVTSLNFSLHSSVCHCGHPDLTHLTAEAVGTEECSTCMSALVSEDIVTATSHDSAR
jgi:hypothetical protein